MFFVFAAGGNEIEADVEYYEEVRLPPIGGSGDRGLAVRFGPVPRAAIII